jgi:hypothetical protein
MKTKPPIEEKKLPRGHAYVRLRNKGYSIHIDFCEVESAVAERCMRAALEEYEKALKERADV